MPTTIAPGLPDLTRSRPRPLQDRHRPRSAGVLGRRGARAGARPRLRVRSRHDAGAARGLRAQPSRDGAGAPRHRQVEPRRAGGGAPQLALRAREPRRPREPHGSDRQGHDRPARRQADHRVPARHPHVGAAAAVRARVRRVRRRPRRRDVRHPARARSGGPPHAARPEPGDSAAPGLPSVRHREHGRPRRRHRAVSRHPAAQPGADGPLEHRGDAQLPGPRPRGGRGARALPRVPHHRRARAA